MTSTLDSIMNPYLIKASSMHQRARYHSDMRRLDKMADPVGSIKYDGANFFLQYDEKGNPSFISRRPSVTGEQIDRTEKLPHLAKAIPEEAGNVYNVELIHTGHDPKARESHPMVSGLLNSLVPRSLSEQQRLGPIRAVVFDHINSPGATFKEKVGKAAELVSRFGDASLMFQPEYARGLAGITALVKHTKDTKREGVIVQDLDGNDADNTRLKIKHINHYNLKVKGIIQEQDIHGNYKPSMGALLLEDATGRDVGKVGTGFLRSQRKEVWEHPDAWIGRLIQVAAMDPTAHKLRSPVFNGDADGQLDTV